MRLAVLDVGSNTVHLLVVDAGVGSAPVPQLSEKEELRLAELCAPDGSVTADGAHQLEAAVARASASAKRLGADDLVAFATSALREAPNGAEVIAATRAATGVDLQVLSGPDEARLTFLAVRRWLGWSAGRLLVLDIGGGSLELAVGVDEHPSVAASVPLGAGRVTRDFLGDSDPPDRVRLAELRAHARELLRPVAADLRADGEPDRVAVTSKTFRTLARLAGAAPSRRGPLVRRAMTHGQLAGVVSRIAAMTCEERAQLDGVSASRARQLVGGAVVADVAMEVLELSEVVVCPWALREGVILRRLDWLAAEA